MPNYFSPGVYTIEKDVSNYPVAGNSSVVGIVGFASKGPVNEPTLITSKEQLIRVFGEPRESIDGQGLEAALEILEATNVIYFVRAATDSAVEASGILNIGTCPAVQVSGGGASLGYGYVTDLYLKIQVGDSNGTAQYADFKKFPLPAGTIDSATATAGAAEGFGAQYLAMQKVIGGQLDSDKVGYGAQGIGGTGHTIYGSFAGSSAWIHVFAFSDSNYSVPLSILRPINVSGLTAYGNFNPSAVANDPNVNAITGGWTSSLKVYGGTIPTPYQNADGVGYFVQSLYPGAGYNLSTMADGSIEGNSVETDALGNVHTKLAVNYLGAQAEQFKVSLTSGSTFIEDVINTGDTNTTSEFIKGYFVSGATVADMTAVAITPQASETNPLLARISQLGLNTATPIVYGGVKYTSGAAGVQTIAIAAGETTISTNARFGKLLDDTEALAGGDSGISATDSENDEAIIGSAAVTPKTGIYALDRDDLNISVAITPGKNAQNIQNALITLAEESQNFLALVSPPYGAINTAQEALDWVNGRSETRSAAINSSYAAVYWPWVKVFSVFDGIDRWYDPAIFAARQMCFTDSVSDPWFAPAGFRRGRLTKPTEVEVPLNQGERDSLYSGGNVINPIVNFPQTGITIFGQRTAQRTPSALDRVNVRRLMIYLRKVILGSTQSFVFEPNDAFTWEAVRNSVLPVLEDIRQRRGIINYSVVCDETVNTPIRVDRNELWCKVVIQPTKSAEVIVFEINVTNQAAKLGG